jgi:AhpD family alkylhydroperoxidase
VLGVSGRTPQEVIEELKVSTRSLAQAAPATWTAFADLHRGAVADGVLSGKFKELMTLATATVKPRDGCIARHAKAAARRGATAPEVAEALGVALLMEGGTASVYAPRAWAAFHEFSEPPIAPPS